MIKRAAQRFDLLLLGKETRFTFDAQMDPDDTLVRVLRDGPRPVVSVPLIVPNTGPIIVAYDGSAQSARALQAFESTGLAVDAEVYVVSVASKRLEAARTADRAMQFLSLHGHRAHAIPLESDSQPAHAILEQVQSLKPQLLVMGAYGEHSIREFFLGTLTRLVLKNAYVPLFLQH